jgi:hypothetical protein
MSGLINKVKDAIHSDKDKKHDSTTTGTHNTHNTHNTSSGLPEGTAGPHGSRAANAADPRVDSDLDSTRRTGAGHTTGGLGSTTGTTGHTTGTAGHTTGGLGHTENMPGHSTGLGSTGHSSGLPEGSVGPHSSRAANAADPRVDSDLDSTRRTGAGHTTGGLGSTTGHTTGTTGHTAGGLGSHTENLPGHSTGLGSTGHSTGIGSTGHSSGLPEGSVGPHGSRAANAADPRVDSDLDSSRRSGGLGGNTYDQTTTGTSGLSSHGAGAHGPTGTHSSGLGGTHSGSHMAGNTAYDSTNPGPAPKTAGPHKSDMLNKADPRVDSNLDGSKTVGKEKTFETS